MFFFLGLASLLYVFLPKDIVDSANVLSDDFIHVVLLLALPKSCFFLWTWTRIFRRYLNVSNELGFIRLSYSDTI